MEDSLSKDDVVANLWAAYTKTREYKSGQIFAIPPHLKLVEDQERWGLKEIYIKFVHRLNQTRNIKEELKNRTIKDWLDEWKEMHHLLFGTILKRCGNWREIDVRFGNPGDELIYHIPTHFEVPSQINALAKTVTELLNKNYTNDEEKFHTLAIIHYQFIRIHPFPDGNGRIARAITDQIALFSVFRLPWAGIQGMTKSAGKHTIGLSVPVLKILLVPNFPAG